MCGTLCVTCIVSWCQHFILFVVLFSDQLPQSFSHQTFVAGGDKMVRTLKNQRNQSHKEN